MVCHGIQLLKGLFLLSKTVLDAAATAEAQHKNGSCYSNNPWLMFVPKFRQTLALIPMFLGTARLRAVAISKCIKISAGKRHHGIHAFLLYDHAFLSTQHGFLRTGIDCIILIKITHGALCPLPFIFDV